MPKELDVSFEKDISVLIDSLNLAIQNALEKYEQLRQSRQKGELSFINISFLLSSVLCELPWLRVDLYDENYLNDITECCMDWDVSNISDDLYRSVNELAKQKDEMKDYELEQAWLNASGEYYEIFKRILPIIIDQCPVAQEIDCEWKFGQFLGTTVIVREKHKNEIL